ncbi:hypothetical protein K466DRAFT_607496 [Polyporus arcularius HHB13444]|uniref:F-box domain-containing protein n=1 Tax=Polyporus arcularius HHB13444 TaxID=1314778 RepID=A0A5C3NNS4_9APHY|nr:hypothetical protein K466DRAFT_607496 [Polyporus arcularius HHB13444]
MSSSDDVDLPRSAHSRRRNKDSLKTDMVTETVAKNACHAVAVDDLYGSMADLQQELRQITEPLNTRPPVNWLPDELLAEIFAFVQAAHRSKGERPHLWLNVVQVCRRWSQVAHSTASLWTTIEVCGRPEWLSRCLVLSKGMLVDIEITDWHDWLFDPQTLLPILQPHHVRVIRSLTMIGIGWISVLSQLLKMGDICSYFQVKH